MDGTGGPLGTRGAAAAGGAGGGARRARAGPRIARNASPVMVELAGGFGERACGRFNTIGTSSSFGRSQNSWLWEAHVDVRRLIEATISGAAAGLAASWIMSQVDGAWKTASSEDQDGDEPNTVKAADAVTEATVGETVPDEYRDATGTAVHYGFGALLGALYGAGVALQPATSAGFGSIYGSAVSLVADEMAMPALGFTPPASEVAASTHLRGFVSHFVFGVSLEAVRRLLVLSFRQQDS